MSDVVGATRRYEAWLAKQVPLVREDLDWKHVQMDERPFAFLRATYYRWAALWREHGGDALDAPVVLAVGDLHTENFGTWRDAERRLVWGVNDFDEAWPLPYTQDLVRLATSAILQIREEPVGLDEPLVCAAILRGYRRRLHKGGRPFVLAERHARLGALVRASRGGAPAFWARALEAPTLPRKAVPARARRLLLGSLPEGTTAVHLFARRGGLGSLGKPRYVAYGKWHGGLVGREAKAATPSATAWLERSDAVRVGDLLGSAVRSPDPVLRATPGWLLRSFGPGIGKMELRRMESGADAERLLRAMGADTANVHHGTPDAVERVLADLHRREPDWLLGQAQAFADRVIADHEAWRNRAADTPAGG